MRWRRAPWYGLVFLSVSIVVILCIFIFLVASPTGTRVTLGLVEKLVPDINIEYRQGSLLNNLRLQHFSFNMDNIEIEVDNLDIEIQTSCLWSRKVCIEAITATQLTYTSQSTASSNNEEKQLEVQNDLNLELISIPIDVEIASFEIKDIQINIDEISISAENFSIGIEIKESNVLLTNPTVSLLQVVLPENSANEPEVTTSTLLPLSNLPTLSIPLDLRVVNLALDRVAVTLSDTTHIFNDFMLSANWKLSSLQLQQFEFRYSDIGELSLQGEANLTGLYPLEVTTNIEIQQLSQWPEVNQSTLSATLQGNIEQLNFTLDSAGSLQGRAQGDIQLSSADLPFALALDILTLPLPSAYSDQVQPSSLSLNADGTLTRQQVQLESNISGFGYDNARLSGNLIHHEQRVEITNLEFIEQENDSSVAATGWLDYQQGITWLGQLNLNNFVLPDIISSQLEAQSLAGQFSGQFNTEGQWDDSIWQVRLFDTDISGRFNQMPAALSGDLSLTSDWSMPASNIHLELNDVALDLQGFNDSNWHVTGTLQANSLAQWQAGLAGQGLLQLDISGALLDPQIAIDGELKQLFWQELSVPGLTIKGQYQPGSNHLSDFDITARDIMSGENNIEQLQLIFSGDLAKQSIQILSNGDISSNISLQGKWLEQESHWQGNLLAANIIYADQELVLENIIDLDLNLADTNENSSPSLNISAHCWQEQDNHLCLKNDATVGESGHLEIELNVDLASLDHLFLPPELALESFISGQISLAWENTATPIIDAFLTINNGQVFVNADEESIAIMNWQEGEFSLNTKDEAANINFTLLQSQQLNPLVDIDLRLFEQYQQIDGHILLQELSLQPITSFADELRELDGLINANLMLNGDLSEPEITGSVDIDQGSIGLMSTPQTLDEITLQLKLNGHAASIAGEFFVEKNKATLNGNAAWQEQFSLDLNLDTEPLEIIYPPQLYATVQSQLALALHAETLLLTGRIDILSGLVTMESLPEGRVNLSRDQVFISDESDQVAESLFGIETNIQVVINEDFKIEGFGFTGNLGGELSLEQTNDQLQVFGSLQIPQGRYRAYGQRLDVTQGEISFTGPAENPAIDFSAVRTIPDEDIEVGILVQGLANNLALSFFSEPAMEESELMSYLVRGRALGTEGGGNSALAVALGSNLMKRTGLLEDLEQASLLNNIVIDTAGQGSDTQATISSYIGERIYVKYGVGVYEPINELTVRLYFLQRLWLETVTGLENSSGDLYYSFEIE